MLCAALYTGLYKVYLSYGWLGYFVILHCFNFLKRVGGVRGCCLIITIIIVIFLGGDGGLFSEMSIQREGGTRC